MVAQILIILYNVVDRFYIGRIPVTGTVALGGVGVCFPLIILITGFTNMFGMGGQGYTEHLLCSPHYLCGSPYGDRRNMGWTDP